MGVNPQRFSEVSDRFMVSETGPFFAHIAARLKYTLGRAGRLCLQHQALDVEGFYPHVDVSSC